MTIQEQAIGIFDSGAGGLTVAAEVKKLLPSENLIYFGDTAHLPYGDKSPELIRFYSKNIADFLLEKNCKVILIACNTASALAYETVKEHVAGKALVVNVIDPTAEYVSRNETIRKVGVIGTKATVNSGMYTRKIAELSPVKQVTAIATPLLVPMIEEGFVYDDISNAIIRSYLSNADLSGIDALILGCTHYPIIKNQIRKFYNFKTDIIDSSEVAAKRLKDLMSEAKILNTSEQRPSHEFYVSDYTDFFKTLAEMFFDTRIDLKKADIWSKI